MEDRLEPPAYLSAEEVERVRPWIERALRYGHGTHDFADVIQEVADNKATLWCFEKSAVVTQLVRHPKLTALTFWLAGGDMHDMFSHHDAIVDWAKRHGATRFVVLGRLGWQRAMGRFGYQPLHYVTYREG